MEQAVYDAIGKQSVIASGGTEYLVMALPVETQQYLYRQQEAIA